MGFFFNFVLEMKIFLFEVIKIFSSGKRKKINFEINDILNIENR